MQSDYLVHQTYTFALQVKELLVLSDNAFSREQVLSTEKSILNKLQWNLTVPTVYVFLLRYAKAAMGDKEVTHPPFSVVQICVNALIARDYLLCA